MELFQELQNLYGDLVKDVELLNSSLSQTARTSAQQNHGMDILKDNLSNIRRLKDKMQQEVHNEDTRLDLSDVVSSCNGLIQFIKHELDEAHIGVSDGDSVSHLARVGTNVNHMDNITESGEHPSRCTQAEIADPNATSIAIPVESKPVMPRLADFCLSETTLSQLKMLKVDQEPEKPTVSWEKNSMALQDMGNTSRTYGGLNSRHVDRPAFDSQTACAASVAPVDWGTLPVGRRDENRAPLADSNLGQLNKTLLSLPPQAPVLHSFEAQQRLFDVTTRYEPSFQSKLVP